MRVCYYRTRNAPKSRLWADSGPSHPRTDAVAHYNDVDGALFTATDRKTGREVWVRLTPAEVDKLLRIMGKA